MPQPFEYEAEVVADGAHDGVDLVAEAAFPDWQPANEKGDDAQLLPALRNGEAAQLARIIHGAPLKRW